MSKLTHDDVCRQAADAFQATNRDDVIAAFVGSLSTRNLPARSAFGSYVVLQHFKIHDFTESAHFSGGNCAVCGMRSEERVETPERVQKYPFQVQHHDIVYAAFDLATFPERKVDSPTDEDRRILTSLLESIRSLPSSAQLTELNKSLIGQIKSNKFQRMILLETFGYAGILCPTKQKYYAKTFVTYDFANSNQPDSFYKREWDYPVRFWTGESGVNEKQVDKFFGRYL